MHTIHMHDVPTSRVRRYMEQTNPYYCRNAFIKQDRYH